VAFKKLRDLANTFVDSIAGDHEQKLTAL